MLEDASERSGDEGVTGSDGVDDLDAEAAVLDELLAIERDCAGVAGRDYRQLGDAAYESACAVDPDFDLQAHLAGLLAGETFAGFRLDP